MFVLWIPAGERGRTAAGRPYDVTQQIEETTTRSKKRKACVHKAFKKSRDFLNVATSDFMRETETLVREVSRRLTSAERRSLPHAQAFSFASVFFFSGKKKMKKGRTVAHT